MNEINKPNDILIATLNAPNASMVDFLLNNINATNTTLLSPDEYKQTPFVKKSERYNLNGVFNESLFLSDYKKAYLNYLELTDGEALKNLSDYLEYSPSDRFKPIGAKTMDTLASFSRIVNPLQQSRSLSEINSIENPTITRKEAALGNHIWDPDIQQFTDKTPETLSLWKKINGDTLVYATYDNDVYDADGNIIHYKGEWKTDENGNYYTEYLRGRELGSKQVVNLQDILTKEGSTLNKIDVFDSDEENKSAFGITMKTLLTIAPYCIPVVGEYYTGLSTAFGLASVLPTFYKSLESTFLGDTLTIATEPVTRLENWFRKFEPSKTDNGSGDFFTYENLGNLVADTVAQLYQQRAAAKAAQWFIKVPKAPKLPTEPTTEMAMQYARDMEHFYSAAKRSNRAQQMMSLGYMGLVSTADIYNETLNAGYDKRTAGILSLASAGALFGIMNFNETTRGLGTWFLKNTTGYEKEVERGVIKKIAKDKMDEVAQGVIQMEQGNSKGLRMALGDFKRKVSNFFDNTLVIGTDSFSPEALWKNAIVEGIEEISEEAIQDALKGITDTLSWLGYTPSLGSFGGWSNVFSKEGFNRYVQTFLGGALGGAIFEGVNMVERKLDPTVQKRLYDLDLAIIDGRGELIIQELQNCKKFYNNQLTATIGYLEDGTPIYMSAKEGGKSQADVIYDEAVAYVKSRILQITRSTDGLSYNPLLASVYSLISQQYKESKFDEIYTQPLWKRQVEKVIRVQDDLKELRSLKTELELSNDSTKEIDAKISEKTKELQQVLQELEDWQNGKNFADITLASIIYLEDELRDKLIQLDVKSYTQNRYGEDYDNLPDTGDSALTKEKIDREWGEVRKATESGFESNITKENILDTLPRVVDLLKKVMPSIMPDFDAFIQNENNKLWMKQSGYYDEDGKFQPGADYSRSDENGTFTKVSPLLEYLRNNPKYWSLSGRFKFDIASALESEGAITSDDYTDEEWKVVKDLINDVAIYSGINVWDLKNLQILLNQVSDILESNPDDNIFAKKLSELRKEKSADAAVSVSFSRLSLANLHKATGITYNSKISSILDIISEDDPFVDKELIDMIKVALDEELTINLQYTLSSLLLTPISKTAVIDILLQGLYKHIEFTDGVNDIIFNSNIDLSGINPSNVNEYKSLIKQLIKELEDFFTPIISSPSFVSDNENIGTLEDFDEFFETLKTIEYQLDNEGILPKEIQEKWNIIQAKSALENPILNIFKTTLRKFGVNRDDVVSYLYNKARGIQQGTAPLELSVKDSQDLFDIQQGLLFLHGVFSCAQESTGGIDLAFNLVMRNLHTLYGNEEDAKKFPVYSLQELHSANSLIDRMLSEISILRGISKEAVIDSTQNDVRNRKEFNHLLADHLRNIEIKSLGDFNKKFEGSDEEFISAVLQEIYKTAQLKIKEHPEVLDDILSELIEKYPNAYELSKTSQEACIDVTPEGILISHLSDSIIFEQLLNALAIDVKTLNGKYIEGLLGKSLIPRFDQELEIKALIAKSYNKELFVKALELLHRKLEASSDKTLYKGKTPAYHVSFVSGGAGTGKTTSIQIYLDALKPKRVFLMAPTLDKVLELRDNIQLSDGVLQDNSTLQTIYQIFGGTKNYDEIFLNELKSLLEVNKDNDKTELDGVFEGIKYRIIRDAKKNISSILVLNPEKIQDLIDISKYKNSTIIVDEASNIGLTTLFLDALAQDPSIEVVTLGDLQLIGASITSQSGVDYEFNIGHFFTHRTHALTEALRLRNSGKLSNCNYYYRLAKKFSNSDRIFDFSDNSNSQQICLMFRDYKLKYNGLKGDEIVKQESDFITKLSQIARQVNDNSKTVKFIYDGTTDSLNELKSLLLKAGFSDSFVNSDIYKTPKTALGGEADFAVIYNLTTEKDPANNGYYVNADTDIKTAYTSISRSKDYSLIYETKVNGLFTSWGITSEQDATIAEFNRDNSIYASMVEQRIAELESINSLLEDVVIEEEKEEADDGEDSPEEPEPPTPTPPVPPVPPTPPSPVSTTEPETKPAVTPPEPEVKPEENSTDEATSALAQLGLKDAITVYGYYIRLGVPLSVTEFGDDWKEKMLELYDKADGNEKSKDLLAFFNLHKNEYSSIDSLINGFIAHRNSLLYNNSDDMTYITFKRKDLSVDYSYIKPNNDESKDHGPILQTVMKRDSDGNYVTILRIGYNAQDGSVFSPTVDAWYHDFANSTELSRTYAIKWLNKNDSKRNEYYNSRGIIAKRGDIEGMVIQEIMPTHSITDWNIDPNIDNNEALFEAYKKGKGTLGELQRLGFKVEVVKFKNFNDFLKAYNQTRFEPVSPALRDSLSQIWSNKWLKVTPITETGDAPFKLIEAKKIKKGTVYSTLSMLGQNLSFYGTKELLDYLAHLCGFEGFKGLNSTVKKKNKVFLERLQAWKTAINDFINSDEFKLLDSELQKWIQRNQKNFFALKGNSINTISKLELSKIQKFLQEEDYLFTFDDDKKGINDDLVIFKCFEAPRGAMLLDTEFDLSKATIITDLSVNTEGQGFGQPSITEETKEEIKFPELNGSFDKAKLQEITTFLKPNSKEIRAAYQQKMLKKPMTVDAENLINWCSNLVLQLKASGMSIRNLPLGDSALSQLLNNINRNC